MKSICVRYTTLDYTRTYAQFRDDVDCFARGLIALGVKSGDKVAIWATNVPQWFIAFWSTVRIGAVLVTVNTAYKSREAEYLLRQADVHTLVMVDGYRDSDYVAAALFFAEGGAFLRQAGTDNGLQRRADHVHCQL